MEELKEAQLRFAELENEKRKWQTGNVRLRPRPGGNKPIGASLLRDRAASLNIFNEALAFLLPPSSCGLNHIYPGRS
jgi:hypothetical protein